MMQKDGDHRQNFATDRTGESDDGERRRASEWLLDNSDAHSNHNIN